MRKVPDNDSEVRLAVRVQPGAAKTEIAGWHGNRVKIRIRERAQDGAANKALIRFLAELLEIPPSCITIDHGLQSRDKVVRILAPEAERIRRAIVALAAPRVTNPLDEKGAGIGLTQFRDEWVTARSSRGAQSAERPHDWLSKH